MPYITSLDSADKTENEMAGVDPLTGLPNRHLFADQLQQVIENTDPGTHMTGLVLLDIDHFKQVNGSVDYDGGDVLLSTVARRLHSCLRPRDLLARFGADEFAIVLAQVDKSGDMEAICDKIGRALDVPFPVKDQQLRITCSLGIAVYPQDASDAGALLHNADTALQRAKEFGRNNRQFYSSDPPPRSADSQPLSRALRDALTEDRLRLHFQPMVDLQNGTVTGIEALARWPHPELGMVAPARFISLAEESGLMAQVGSWILRRACQHVRQRQQDGLANVPVSVNVSARQFHDAGFVDELQTVLSEYQIDPANLCLEITEKSLVQDSSASDAILERLKALGVTLVLDDFGTGFASLSYLKRFAFDKIKIDRSFIAELVTDADAAAMTKAIISMAHSLGIQVVAEGVESEAQCDFLRRNMCDEIQGFLFSAALPAEDVNTFLHGGHRLPAHLLRLQKPPRTLLLVDDETNILASLKRLLRRDNYRILTASTGEEGLEILGREDVDVILSDQRMPGLTGVEFLSRAKETHPDTVRMVLSGYTELQSVTDAVNQGAIYKFLVKPWDDEQLRGHIEEAFRRKEMADENQRLQLELRTANFALEVANRRLEEVLRLQQQQITRDEVSLDIVREALQQVPLAIFGIDDDGLIVFANAVAQADFSPQGALLGCDIGSALPELAQAIQALGTARAGHITLQGKEWRLGVHAMGSGSRSRGQLMILSPG